MEHVKNFLETLAKGLERLTASNAVVAKPISVGERHVLPLCELSFAWEKNIKYYMPGIILLLLAITIIAVPEIIVAFIAATIIMAGIGALYIGHRIRKSEIEVRKVDEWISDEDSFGRRFVRNPFTKDWRRWS